METRPIARGENPAAADTDPALHEAANPHARLFGTGKHLAGAAPSPPIMLPRIVRQSHIATGGKSAAADAGRTLNGAADPRAVQPGAGEDFAGVGAGSAGQLPPDGDEPHIARGKNPAAADASRTLNRSDDRRARQHAA